MNKFLIKNPVISEKSTAMSAFGKYVFLVDSAANATEVKKLVEQMYKVKVVDTHVVNARPKPKRYGRNFKLRPGFKKIIVTLKKGQKLDILPQ